MSIALINHGNEIQVVTPTVNNNLIDHLPAKVYTIKIDPMTGALSLVIDRESFELPKKLYGDLPDRRDVIWNTYCRSENSTGILLFGKKGMGKSIMAESLCNKAIGMGIPVLYIRERVPPSILYMLAKNISPLVFMFDEFEKVYDEINDQQMLLTLFSDQDIKKQMFLVLGNEVDEIDINYIHRPGRFMFYILYGILDLAVGNEIIDNNIDNDDIRLALKFYNVMLRDSLNYDILQSIVKAAANMKTVEDVIDYMYIMNVPRMKALMPHIAAVELQDENGIECYGEIRSSYMDEKKEIMKVEIYATKLMPEGGEDISQKLTLVKTLNVNIETVERIITENILSSAELKIINLTDSIRLYVKADSVTMYRNGKNKDKIKLVSLKEKGSIAFPFEHEKLTSHRIKASAEKVATNSLSGSMPLSSGSC